MQLQRLEADDEIMMSSYGTADGANMGIFGLEFDRVEYLPNPLDELDPKGGIDCVNQIKPFSV